MERLVYLMMVVMVMLTVGIANAGIIYQEDFSGDGSGLLNTTSPEVDNYGSGGNSWSSNAGFYSDGDVRGGDGSAVLPFVPQAGSVYELSANLTGNASSADWFGIGFTTNALLSPTASNGADRFSNTGGYSWILYRNTNTTNQVTLLTGKNTTGTVDYLGELVDDVTVPHLFTIILDTTGTTWTTELLLDGISVGGPLNMQTSAAADIKYVGITSNFSNDAGTATVDNFVLSQVPEPATLLILGLGASIGLIRRK